MMLSTMFFVAFGLPKFFDAMDILFSCFLSDNNLLIVFNNFFEFRFFSSIMTPAPASNDNIHLVKFFYSQTF